MIISLCLASTLITFINANSEDSVTQRFPILEEVAHIKDTGGDTFQTIIDNELLIAIDMDGGLKFFDITNPSEPTLLSSFYDGGMPHDIHKVGDLLYLADYHQGLEIYNINDPTTPVKLGVIVDDGDGVIGGVFVKDDCAFVSEYHHSTGDSILKIINVSNPENPTEIIEYIDEDNEFHRFYVEEDVCFATCLGSGFKILNVSNLNAITEIAHYSDLSETYNIQKVNDKVYLTDAYGLVVLNVAKLDSPEFLGNYSTDSLTFNLAIEENLAFISVYQTGIQILNITNLQNITKITEFSAANIIDVKVHNNLIFLAMHSDGLLILKMIWEKTNGLSIPIISAILALPILFVFNRKRCNIRKRK